MDVAVHASEGAEEELRADLAGPGDGAADTQQGPDLTRVQ